MFEHRSAPLVSRKVFARRMAVHGGYVAVLLLISLVGGTAGFHWLAGQSVIDAWLNSAMLLGGMGPVGEIRSTPGKLFASFYSLYAGLVFIGGSTILAAPVIHRFLHRFHLEDRKRG
jgi:hypothetical protein